jgi:hypothetical protein
MATSGPPRQQEAKAPQGQARVPLSPWIISNLPRLTTRQGWVQPEGVYRLTQCRYHFTQYRGSIRVLTGTYLALVSTVECFSGVSTWLLCGLASSSIWVIIKWLNNVIVRLASSSIWEIIKWLDNVIVRFRWFKFCYFFPVTVIS